MLLFQNTLVPSSIPIQGNPGECESLICFSSFLQRSATQKKFKQTKEIQNEKVRYLTLGEKINSFSEGALPKRNFNKLEINKQES